MNKKLKGLYQSYVDYLEREDLADIDCKNEFETGEIGIACSTTDFTGESPIPDAPRHLKTILQDDYLEEISLRVAYDWREQVYKIWLGYSEVPEEDEPDLVVPETIENVQNDLNANFDDLFSWADFEIRSRFFEGY